MKKLKLGVVPIKRTFLPMEAAKAQKDEFMPVIRSIKSDYVEIIDVDELTENGIAFTYDVIAPIVKKLKDNEIDALFRTSPIALKKPTPVEEADTILDIATGTPAVENVSSRL